MDFNILQKKILHKAAREKSHDSWESMKRQLNESHARFVERVVLLTLEECLKKKEEQRILPN